MIYGNEKQAEFFSEMAEHQISAEEFFSTVLLDSLERNFDLHQAVIYYFDTEGNFLSWVRKEEILLNEKGHPYREFMKEDVVRHMIYEDACREHLTYFDVKEKLYRSTELIRPENYESSSLVRFMEKEFHAHYSVSMAFGINAYIQVSFFKSREEGDFTEAEMQELREIYHYIASSYKNFKKYEQAKIIANIQSEVISSGEKAYLITDDFMHLMSFNALAKEYLREILGEMVDTQLSISTPCSWLPFLLGNEGSSAEERVKTRVIKNFVFKIYTYDRRYSNGIVDRYHWITISKKEKQEDLHPAPKGELTQTEQQVAELLAKGLTYKAIADELVVSYHTVKNHVQNIYSKCGVNSRFELYKWMGK